MSEDEKPGIIIRERRGGHGGHTSRTAQYTCPWCGVLTTASTSTITDTEGEPWITFLTVVCSDLGCRRAALITVEYASKMAQVNGVASAGTATLYPPGRSKYAAQGVPETIAKDFREAWDCYAAGFYYGAALVGRRVLQAGVRAIVGDGYNTLNQELNALPPNALNEDLRNATHEVRHIGNDAAHADEVTRESVLDLLTFTEDVLYALLVVPARVAASRARRGTP